jgi:hypothetical protein
MNFQDLHELLRLELLRRVDRGTLTGTSLARQTGFKQGHISNVLRGKRALSLEGLDRVLAAQELTVDELMPGGSMAGEGLEISAGASQAGISTPIPTADAIERIPVVSAAAAANEAVVRAGSVLDTVPVAAGRLEDGRTAASPRRTGWQRFVAIRADGAQAAAMDPVIQPGSIVVLDRHYVSAAPYRTQQRTVFAVRSGSGLTLRYVEFDSGALVLRPLSLDFPVEVVRLGAHETSADYLVGRVCLVVSEL